MSLVSEELENMETEENTEEIEDEIKPQKKKKPRQFFAKEFRRQLSSTNAYNSVKEFINLCVYENAQDYALEYLESSGSCIEIVRIIDTLENKSAANVVPILEALCIILLKIISSHPQKTVNGEESCRELLNKHFSLIKSCLALSSNTIQRKIGLKLLTTMVTLSDKLAKEVLTQIFFDESCLQVLTSPSNADDGSSVRTSFIHFIISFLIEGQTDVVQLLLQKQFLLQCVFPGLVYDSPEIIEVFLSTVQKIILENSDLSKTVKMNIFSQKIIQNIVNLFEWKGPQNWNPNKKKSTALVVAQDDKQFVCDITQQFLTILCTSKKFGIVFQDETLGLSNTKHNSLLLNVVKSLNKPWNNKYVSSLVTNICVACPDIIKDVLYDIDVSLEVRLSQNWLNVMHFIKNIFQNLNPENIDKFLPKLTSKQLLTVVQNFCVPQNILKVILSQGIVHEHIGIRHESILLLNILLNSLEKYLNVINTSTEINPATKQYLKDNLTNYLNKNLPQASILLKDWHKFHHESDDEIILVPEYSLHLTLLLDILYKYKLICPELVDEITTELDVNNFLKTIENLTADPQKTIEMQIKALNLFISFDASFFHPSKELFSYIFPLLLKLYVQNNKNAEIEQILNKILNVTGIFEGCDHEIYIFLYSILELDILDENLSQFLTNVFKDTSEQFLKYNSEIDSLKDGSNSDTTFSIKNWLQVNSKQKYSDVKLKHTILSPLIVGLLNQLLIDNSETERINTILVHLLFAQTNNHVLVSLVLQEKYKTIVSKHLIKYCRNTDINNLNQIKKLIPPKNDFIKIFNYILSEDSSIDVSNINLPTYYSTLLTNFLIYYYTQSSVQQKLTESSQKKCLQIIFLIINKSISDKTLENCLNSILKHPVLLQLFSPTQVDKQTIEFLCTGFIVEIIEHLLKTETKDSLEGYLQFFRGKLVGNICSLLGNFNLKTGEFYGLLKIVQIFGFNFEQSSEILKIISDLSHTVYIEQNIVSEILSYILNNNYGYLNPFNSEIITKISKCVQEINSSVDTNLDDLENNFCCYISRFPHTNEYLDSKLFESLLKKTNTSKSSIKLATTLIKHNQNLIKIFEENISTIFEKRELIFSILNVIKDYEGSKNILENVYKEYEQIILKFVNKPQKISNYLIDNYAVVVKLVQEYMSVENCNNIVSKVQKYDVTEHYHTEVLLTIFNKSILQETNPEKQIKLCTNFIITFMNLLTNSLKRQELDWDKIEEISKDFNTYLIKIKHVYKLQYNDETIYKNAAFQNFSKLCLKFGLQNRVILIVLLKRICALTEALNQDLGTLFEMSISHSESLNILLSDKLIKPPYLSLLLVLCKKCPSVMAKSHIPVFLGAYSATLNESDQCILQLLGLYEKADLGFHEYRPYLWGPPAITHYSVKTGGSTNLWRQPSPKNVLDIFVEDKIKHTVVNFPKTRKLRQVGSLYSESDLNVYDPCFYLPLLSHILAPESTVRWYNITNRGVICLVIICLTSECEDIRAAACHVLARFHSHVEAAQYAKKRLLWQHLTESICLGTSALPTLTLSSPVAVFLCRCAAVFTKPDEPLYKPLGLYFMAKQSPNFTQVPELLEMLFNTSVVYKTHRGFILRVIRDGIHTEKDLKIGLSLAFSSGLVACIVRNLALYAKKRLLWQHLTESICLGTSALPSLTLSSPVAVFLCRCAAVFTKPDEPLYKPLGHYFMAKQSPNFTQVPELLEMLFNTSVVYKTHRGFILRVIKDGIHTEKDLEVIFRSLVFKLTMDLYNSSLSNLESKKLILEIISKAVSIPLGSQILITNYSLLSWLHTILQQISVHEYELLDPLIDILSNLVTHMPFTRLKHYKFKILLILVATIDKLTNSKIELNQMVKFVKVLYLTYERRPDILSRAQLSALLSFSSKFTDCNICNYYLNFGITFIEKPNLKTENPDQILRYYLELLTLKWIETNKS